jgi:hypothetical protein
MNKKKEFTCAFTPIHLTTTKMRACLPQRQLQNGYRRVLEEGKYQVLWEEFSSINHN